MNHVHLSIPAKALLFGEYGVLFGGKAIAVTFFDHYFEISLKIKNFEENSSIQIKSDFFTNKNILFSTNDFENSLNQDPNIFFFVNLLKPWKHFLNHSHLEIEIHKSFSPALGFGSSSALIAGVSSALWQLIFQNQDYLNQIEFWNYIKQSITNIQGSGSGYDVAVQLAALKEQETNSKTKCWIFQNKNNSIVPSISHFVPDVSIFNLGCFVSTNIYSNTSKIIRKFQNTKDKKNFANKHAEISDLFLTNQSIENIQICMNKSIKIAKEQDILPTNDIKLNQLISTFNSKQISFKTMGAGHGDCLWVLANKNKLITECRISEIDIPFAFETYGTES